MKLSLIVPCYNEEQVIEQFYDVASEVFSAEDYEVEYIFINDGSTDHTLSILKKIYKRSAENINIISFSRNFGKEAAMFAGLKASTGDYICIIDADLQQRPEIAAKMVSLLEKYPEYDCIGTKSKNRNGSGAISFIKGKFYSIISKMSHIEFVQDASDFRTFRRSMADALIEMGDYNRFTKGLFAWVGFNTRYLTYDVQKRAAGESKWSLGKLIRYAFDGIISFSVSPLRFATILGAISSFIGIFYLIFYFIFALAGKYQFHSSPIIIALIAMFSGFILIALGILGEYLAKVFDQVKSRPIYIAKEILTQENKEQSIRKINEEEKRAAKRAESIEKKKEELRKEKKQQHIEALKKDVEQGAVDYAEMIKQSKKNLEIIDKEAGTVENSEAPVTMEEAVNKAVADFLNDGEEESGSDPKSPAANQDEQPSKKRGKKKKSK